MYQSTNFRFVCFINTTCDIKETTLNKILNWWAAPKRTEKFYEKWKKKKKKSKEKREKKRRRKISEVEIMGDAILLIPHDLPPQQKKKKKKDANK